MPVDDLAEPVENASEATDRRLLTRDTVLLLVLGAIVFALALPTEFLGLVARYALFAKEMLRNGPSVFPTTYLGPYP